MKENSPKGLKMGSVVGYHSGKKTARPEEPIPAMVRKVLDEDTVDLTTFPDGNPTVKNGVKREGKKLRGDTGSDDGYFSEIEYPDLL